MFTFSNAFAWCGFSQIKYFLRGSYYFLFFPAINEAGDQISKSSLLGYIIRHVRILPYLLLLSMIPCPSRRFRGLGSRVLFFRTSDVQLLYMTGVHVIMVTNVLSLVPYDSKPSMLHPVMSEKYLCVWPRHWDINQILNIFVALVSGNLAIHCRIWYSNT